MKKDYPKGIKIVDGARRISGYADYTQKESSYSETVAEAFNDVYSNGNAAQPLSSGIVQLLKAGLK